METDDVCAGLTYMRTTETWDRLRLYRVNNRQDEAEARAENAGRSRGGGKHIVIAGSVTLLAVKNPPRDQGTVPRHRGS